MTDSKTKDLSELLQKTGHAHHAAFIATDGEDPEWAIWYAKFLEKPLSDLLNKEFTQSRIVYELVNLEENADLEKGPWPHVYAEILLKKYG